MAPVDTSKARASEYLTVQGWVALAATHLTYVRDGYYMRAMTSLTHPWSAVAGIYIQLAQFAPVLSIVAPLVIPLVVEEGVFFVIYAFPYLGGVVTGVRVFALATIACWHLTRWVAIPTPRQCRSPHSII